jgi:hypothetical protein
MATPPSRGFGNRGGEDGRQKSSAYCVLDQFGRGHSLQDSVTSDAEPLCMTVRGVCGCLGTQGPSESDRSPSNFPLGSHRRSAPERSSVDLAGPSAHRLPPGTRAREPARLRGDGRNHRTAASREEPAGSLGGHWLASEPADSLTIDSHPAGFLHRATVENPLFASFVARIYEQAVCNPGGDGDTIDTHCGVPSAQPHGGRTDLADKARFLRQQRQKPYPTIARAGTRLRPRCGLAPTTENALSAPTERRRRP